MRVVERAGVAFDLAFVAEEELSVTHLRQIMLEIARDPRTLARCCRAKDSVPPRHATIPRPSPPSAQNPSKAHSAGSR
jgi:hypothetical protein